MVLALLRLPLEVALPSSGDEFELFVFLLLAFGGGIVAIYWGWTRYERYSVIRNTPTSKIRSMAVGRTELEGTAKPVDAQLDAPFTDDPCLYATWTVEEYRKDPDDNDYDWVTVASGELASTFYLEDETGRVLVQADEETDFDLSDAHETTVIAQGRADTPPAIVEFIENSRRDWSVDDLLSDPLGSFSSVFDDDRIGHSHRRRRYSQNLLPVGETTYVFGAARPRNVDEIPDREASSNEDLLVVERDDATGLFLVSDRSEERLVDYYSKMSPLAIVGGLVASAVALYFLLSWYVLV